MIVNHDDDMDDDHCTAISRDMQPHAQCTRSRYERTDAMMDASSREPIQHMDVLGNRICWNISAARLAVR